MISAFPSLHLQENSNSAPQVSFFDILFYMAYCIELSPWKGSIVLVRDLAGISPRLCMPQQLVTLKTCLSFLTLWWQLLVKRRDICSHSTSSKCTCYWTSQVKVELLLFSRNYHITALFYLQILYFFPQKLLRAITSPYILMPFLRCQFPFTSPPLLVAISSSLQESTDILSHSKREKDYPYPIS